MKYRLDHSLNQISSKTLLNAVCQARTWEHTMSGAWSYQGGVSVWRRKVRSSPCAVRGRRCSNEGLPRVPGRAREAVTSRVSEKGSCTDLRVKGSPSWRPARRPAGTEAEERRGEAGRERGLRNRILEGWRTGAARAEEGGGGRKQEAAEAVLTRR